MSETHLGVTATGLVKDISKVKFASLTSKQFYSSSQNVLKPSQGKDSYGNVLGHVYRQVLC